MTSPEITKPPDVRKRLRALEEERRSNRGALWVAAGMALGSIALFWFIRHAAVGVIFVVAVVMGALHGNAIVRATREIAELNAQLTREKSRS